MQTENMWHEDVDWWELVWFVGVTVGVHAGVVSLLCAALMVVERYKLFPEAKIQTKVTYPSPFYFFSCMIDLSILSH